MKTLVPFLFTGLALSLANTSFAKDYEACAATRDGALQDLAAQMHVTVDSEVTMNASEKTFAWIILTERNNSVRQSVTTNIDIIGADINKKDGKICASLTEVNMVKNAKKHIDEIIKIGNKQRNAKSFKDRLRHARNIIDQVRTGGSLVVIAKYDDKLGKSKFEQYDKAVTSAQDLSRKGAVRFSGDKSSSITFAGKTLSYGESSTIAPGEYSYQAIFNNACNQSSTITIEKGIESVVSLEKQALPRVSFTSPDVDSKDVRLTFNGKRLAISESITINKGQLDNNCDGSFSWQAEFGSQQDSGNVNLSGGDEEVVTLDFLSGTTIKKIKGLSASWRTGNVIEGAGSFWMPSHKNDPDTGKEIGENFSNIQITYLKSNGAIAYGPTLDYSTFNDAESYHLGYQVRFQMTEVGAEGMPFVLFQLPLIPFLYGQASVGYMSYTNDNGDHQRTEQDEWKNYLMGSFGVGASLILSKDFALVAKGQKNYGLDAGGVFYLGASVRF
jgi:hypothetical protein